jgi:hypothetical protein
MDPVFITATHWNDIFRFVHFLWALPLFTIGFAFNLLFAQAVVPSLVGTGNISAERARLLRPVLYAFSAASLAALVWVFYNLASQRGIFSQLYERLWI